MTRRDWGKDRQRQMVRDRGAEPVDGAVVPFGPPARRKPKGSLRDELAALLAAPVTEPVSIAKIIRCPCGHVGKVRLPADMLAGRKFRCSKCGRKIG